MSKRGSFKLVERKEYVYESVTCDVCSTNKVGELPNNWFEVLQGTSRWSEGFDSEHYCSAKCYFDAMATYITCFDDDDNDTFNDLTPSQCEAILKYINNKRIEQ